MHYVATNLVQLIKGDEKGMKVLEMWFCRRLTRASWIQKVTNEQIIEKVMKQSLLMSIGGAVEFIK